MSGARSVQDAPERLVRRLALRLRAKYGEAEGYGIVFDFSGAELSGATLRAPDRLYSVDTRRKDGKARYLVSVHVKGEHKTAD